MLASSASLIGTELLHCSHCGTPAFIYVGLPLRGKALVLLVRVFAFFLYYLKAFEHGPPLNSMATAGGFLVSLVLSF